MRLSLVKGGDWATFCRDFIGQEPDFLREMEDGVRILEGKGHTGPIAVAEARNAVAQVMAEVPVLREQGRPRKAEGENKDTNGMFISKQGNTVEYRCSRLKRADAKLAKKVQDGVITLLEAEKAAGLHKDSRMVYVPSDASKAARAIRDKFGEDFAKELAKALR